MNFLSFKLSFNDYYSQDISNKIKAVKKRKAQKGEFQGNSAPYGYKKDPENKNHLVVDEEVKPVIQEIFKLYLGGNTTSQIAKIMNDRGIESPGVHIGLPQYKKGECIWKRYAVYTILKNPVYIGTMVGLKTQKTSHKVKQVKINSIEKREIVEHTHEPIIEKRIFEMANNKIKSLSTTRCRKHDHELKGLVYCAECGSRATIKAKSEHNKNGTTRITLYYICGRRNSDKNSCRNGTMTAKKISDIVLKEVQEECKKIKYSKKELEEIYSQARENSTYKKKTLKKQIEEQEHKLKQMENQIDELYTDKTEKRIMLEDFTRLYNNILDKKEKTIKTIQQLKAEFSLEQEVKIIKYDKIRKIAGECLKLENVNKEVLNQLIDKVEFTEDKQIKIRYKFAEYK